ncbi:MAG: Na/Pi symporter [Thermoanaerobacteraceae bacterium]|nr:Na/Pi symporter [Thermoanaerobacteraceae bacterium]
MNITDIGSSLGAIALLIYGTILFSSSVQELLGNRLIHFLNFHGKNNKGFILSGLLLSLLIENSVIVRNISLGFLKSGIISVDQTLGIIMGSNLGSTLLNYIAYFRPNYWSYVLLALGTALYFFYKDTQTKSIGKLLLSTGFLFFCFFFLRTHDLELGVFVDRLNISSIFVGLIIGLISAFIFRGFTIPVFLLQILLTQGFISFDATLPVLISLNIGSIFVLSRSNEESNRLIMWSQLIIYCLTSLIVLTFSSQFIDAVNSITSNGMLQIAVINTIINAIAMLISLIFLGNVTSVVGEFIHIDNKKEKQLELLDERILVTPALALEQIKKIVYRMGLLSLNSLEKVMNSFISQDSHGLNQVFENDKMIKEMEEQMNRYLVILGKNGLPGELSATINNVYDIMADIISVSNSTADIAHYTQESIDANLTYSSDGIKELKGMYAKVHHILQNSLSLILEKNKDKANLILQRENEVDTLQIQLRNDHIERLNRGECIPQSGLIYIDIISELERVSDHGADIAYIIKGD